MRLVRFRYSGNSYSGEHVAMRSQRPRGRWFFMRNRTDTTFGPIPMGAPN
jgi:hypothetical protein